MPETTILSTDNRRKLVGPMKKKPATKKVVKKAVKKKPATKKPAKKRAKK